MSKALPSYLVVSVDYRKAPAHLYPTPLNDVEIVYRFLVEHAISYKVDVNRIVVAGDSAGGRHDKKVRETYGFFEVIEEACDRFHI